MSTRRASLVAQLVKNLHAMRATQVRSLGWEDPLEKEMAIHSSILAWKISWTQLNDFTFFLLNKSSHIRYMNLSQCLSLLDLFTYS